MPLIVLGLNHQTAPVALRERVAFESEHTGSALANLRKLNGIHEAALLSTCNRTEIYLHAEDPSIVETVAAWLAAHHGLSAQTLTHYLYSHFDTQAVRHLFRVATGLDSLILGEPQILGQVKQAWQLARIAGSLQTPLDRLFQQCFSVAKRVRTDTRIGAHPVSVAFAAVRLARQVFAELDRASVMLIGAGDTIELAAKHLADAKVKRLLVANRTLEHAQSLAGRFGGYALPLSELSRHLPEADIVITATAARLPIVQKQMVSQALKARRHQPMFLLDLAVPRDIAEDVRELSDVFLYTVDDLEQVIEDNRSSRREAARQAEAIIDLQVDHFMAWWQARSRQDALLNIRHYGQTQRDLALARAQTALAAGEPAQQVIERLANQLTNKLLHAPSVAVRQAALDGDTDLLHSAQRLFDTDLTIPFDDSDLTS